jgi:hypothetical protein
MRDHQEEKNGFFTISGLQTILKKAYKYLHPPLWNLERIHVRVEVHRKK